MRATDSATETPSSQPSGAAYGLRMTRTWNEPANRRLHGTGSEGRLGGPRKAGTGLPSGTMAAALTTAGQTPWSSLCCEQIPMFTCCTLTTKLV